MALHKLRIIQVAQVERSIVVEVEANSFEEAIEIQQSEAAPSLEDPGWTIDKDTLQQELVIVQPS